MKKYYTIFPANYGLTVVLIGEFETMSEAMENEEDAVHKIDPESSPLWCLDESGLRAFMASAQNVLQK